LQGQVEELQEQVSDLTEQVNILTSEKAELEQQLADAQQAIAEKDAEISGLQSQISQLQGQVADLTNQVSNLISEKAALQTLLTQLNDNLTLGLISIQDDFRRVFKNPDFAIPGETNVEQYQNLIQTILDMSKGEKNPIYKGLMPPKN
jgi:chromosome segregation ATPase